MLLVIELFLRHAHANVAKVRHAGQAGQATVEYVVVVLAASLLAGLFIKWVNGTGKISELLDRLLDVIIGTVS